MVETPPARSQVQPLTDFIDADQLRDHRTQQLIIAHWMRTPTHKSAGIA
jgi:hypothetical protein